MTIKGTLSVLFQGFIIAILPVWGWATYLDSSRHGKWGTPTLDWVAIVGMVLIGLIGVLFSMRTRSLAARIVVGTSYIVVSTAAILFIGFASVVANV
jgi:hypothetical protein